MMPFMSTSSERKRKSDEHSQAVGMQDAGACDANGDHAEKRVKTEPVVKSEAYESDGNECDTPPPTLDHDIDLSTADRHNQNEEDDDRGQLRARLIEIEIVLATSEAQIAASQRAEKEAKDALEVEATKNRIFSEYIDKLETRIRALTEETARRSRKTSHKAEPLTLVDNDSSAGGKSAGTKQMQNVKCLPPKAVAARSKTVIIKWPRTYVTVDTQTDGVHCVTAMVQTDDIGDSPRQPSVAVSDSAIQTETASASSRNLRDTAAQTVRAANANVQTETTATSYDACSQTVVPERTEAAAQTDGTLQDYDGMLTKARRRIAHLLQAALDAKKDVVHGSYQLKTVKQKNEKLLSKIYRLKDKLSAAKCEIGDLSASRDHFEMELFAVDLRLAEANDTIAQLTADLASAYESNEELEELLDARILEIEMLQENHATGVEGLQKALHDKSLELAALNAKLNDFVLEKEQTLTELSAHMQQKEAQIERLSSRLSDVEWDRDQCREKWRNEIEQLERELRRMRNELIPRFHDAVIDSGQSWRRGASGMLPSPADVNASRIPRYLRHDGADESVYDAQHTFFR